MIFGPVAQLNRVSDSGSEGSGFEPQRGHKKRTTQRCPFFDEV